MQLRSIIVYMHINMSPALTKTTGIDLCIAKYWGFLYDYHKRKLLVSGLYLVVPYVLSLTPLVFQCLINDMMKDFFDNILICSPFLNSNVNYKQVLNEKQFYV